jgi:hypothetical protein
MDPNACWERIAVLLSVDGPIPESDYDELTELCESLVTWCVGGGFLPIWIIGAHLDRNGFVRILDGIAERYSVS